MQGGLASLWSIRLPAQAGRGNVDLMLIGWNALKLVFIAVYIPRIYTDKVAITGFSLCSDIEQWWKHCEPDQLNQENIEIGLWDVCPLKSKANAYGILFCTHFTEVILKLRWTEKSSFFFSSLEKLSTDEWHLQDIAGNYRFDQEISWWVCGNRESGCNYPFIDMKA